MTEHRLNPTPERLARGDLTVGYADARAGSDVVFKNDAPLVIDRLLEAGIITDEQHQNAEWYRSLHVRVFGESLSPVYNPARVFGGEAGPERDDLENRIKHVRREIGWEMGEAAGKVFDLVVIDDKPPPNAPAEELLGKALDVVGRVK